MSDISRTKEPRTAPPEARRKQLIEATITAISKHGIAGTTLIKVTQEAGLSLGLANFHFDSKDALLAATLRQLAEEHRALWIDKSRQPDLSAAAKLQAIVNAQFHPKVCNRRKLSVWFAFFGDTPHRSAYLQTSGELDRERQRVTADLCARIIAARGYTTVSPLEVSRMLEALFDGLWLNILMYPDLFDRNTARDQVNGYLARCFKEDFL